MVSIWGQLLQKTTHDNIFNIMKNIINLQTEILHMILANLNLYDMSRVVQVCRQFRELGEDPVLRRKMQEDGLLVNNSVGWMEKCLNCWWFKHVKLFVFFGSILDDKDMMMLQMFKMKHVTLLSCDFSKVSPDIFAMIISCWETLSMDNWEQLSSKQLVKIMLLDKYVDFVFSKDSSYILIM